MLLILLAVVVVVYFVVAIRLARRRYPGKPSKAWAAVLAGFLVIFVVDHLIGLTHAYTWVRRVPSPPALPMATDHILLEFDLQDRESEGAKLTAAQREAQLLLAYAMAMVSSEAADAGEGGLKGSYSRLQAMLFTEWGPKVIDLMAVADAKAEACQFFHSLPADLQSQWRALAAKGLEDGARAACAAISHAVAMRSEHLYRVASRTAAPLERLLGVGGTATSSVSEIQSGRVLAEHRSMRYSGGWVQRTFWASDASSAEFETPGPVPSLRPATRQRVLLGFPKSKPR
jgi:hypothetical protein